MPEMIYIALCLLAVTVALAFIFLKLRPKKLDPKVRNSAKQKIKATSKLDPNLAIIESHKILTNTVQTMFKKKLSSAKLLNKVSKRFKDEEEFWYYHRMRNRVAHESDFRATKADSTKARKAFQAALSSL